MKYLVFLFLFIDFASIRQVDIKKKESSAPANEKWVSLFNGETLDGWHTTGYGFWHVENGMIVGTRSLPEKGGYLFTNKDTYKDFELVAYVNIDWGVDSGIALRDVSTSLETQAGEGYHCCLDFWGDGKLRNGHIGGFYYKTIKEKSVYAEFKKTWPYQFKDPFTTVDSPLFDSTRLQKFYPSPEFSEIFNEFSWNKIKIRIEGNPPLYQCWINDVKTIEYKDNKIRNHGQGKIGLQIINDPNWEQGKKIRFKNIYVKELNN